MFRIESDLLAAMFTARSNLDFLHHVFSCEFQPRKNLQKMHIRKILALKRRQNKRFVVFFAVMEFFYVAYNCVEHRAQQQMSHRHIVSVVSEMHSTKMQSSNSNYCFL